MNNLCERHGRLRCGECAYIAQLEEVREILIDALQTIVTDTEDPFTAAFAKRKLKEIGVTVE